MNAVAMVGRCMVHQNPGLSAPNGLYVSTEQTEWPSRPDVLSTDPGYPDHRPIVEEP